MNTPQPRSARWLRSVTLSLLFLVSLSQARAAQSFTLVSESFSAAITTPWVVGDSNATAPSQRWGSVADAYGTPSSHSRPGKAYAAAFINAGTTNTTATYGNNLASTLSRTINLSTNTYGALRFWYNIPSLGAGDSWAVFSGNTSMATDNRTTSDWVERRISLNTQMGANRLLRFVFGSDSAGTAEGMYLDDIEVTTANQPLTEQFTSFSVANYSGYLIDSDAGNTNASFNRDSIQASVRLDLENFLTVTTNIPYVFTFRLRDTNGAVFPIYNVSGSTTNAGYTLVQTNTAAIPSVQQLALSTIGLLKPAARLDHHTAYRVEVSVARTNGVVLFNATNAPLHYYHFTNMVSGDADYNVIAELKNSGWEQTWLMNTAPGSNAFLLTNDIVIRRYDSFLSSLPPFDIIPFRLDVELRNAATDALIPLAFSASNYFTVLSSYTLGSSNPVVPRATTNELVFSVKPAGQLDSVNATYKITARLSYTNSPGQPAVVAESITNAAQRLLAYNGRLVVGDINTTMHAFSALPVPGAVTPGSNIVTTVYLSPNSATVDGVNGPTFGNGNPLSTKLLVNGDALLTSGLQIVNNAQDGSQGNISFTRGTVVLNNNGAIVTDVTFHMPTGFGYHTNTYQARGVKRLLTDLSFPNVGLNQSLSPKSNLTLFGSAAAPIHAMEETKSIYIMATQMMWNATSGRFELLYTPSIAETLDVRFIDYLVLQLASSNLYQTNMAIKRSNDRYLSHTLSFTGPALITADANGNALLNGTLAFTSAGAFQTHFPYDTAVQWSGGGGFMVISNDVVVVGPGSYLTGVGNLHTPYVGDCDGCSSSPTTNRVGITPANNRLSFSRDGGLVGGNQGPVLYTGLSGKVAWGKLPSPSPEFAQSVLAPTNVTFAMPGVFLRGDDNTLGPEQGPGVILFTGANVSNSSLNERPNSLRYKLGTADYAGMNVRTLADGFINGRSVLAGQPANYELRGNSKYYLRLGGVSGMHSAVGGTFPANLTLWGYAFGFSNYSLAFLDNENTASRTDGYISLPLPSDIIMEFQEMVFTCTGKPESAKLPPSAQQKYLSYWNADIEPHVLSFVSEIGQDCNVNNGFLTLGVSGYASPINSALHGTLGFKPNGTLISKSDNIADLDSRLKLPNHFAMKGANKVDYQVTTVGDAYYNRYLPQIAPEGFINFVGQMNVPFFEDIRVHAHSSARKAPITTPLVYLMGGWTRDDSPNDSHGWLNNAGESYFNASYFDPSNNGWPTSIELERYRNNGDDEDYHPRAQKLWLDIVELDYPLKWSPASRNFRSFEAQKTDLIVFQVTHQVSGLDAKAASLDFGAAYGSPKINTADFFLDLLEDEGVFQTISNAIGGNNFTAMLNSMLSLNTLLEDTGEKLIETSLDPFLNPLMTETYNDLKAIYNSANPKVNFPSLARVYLTNDFGSGASNQLYQFGTKVTEAGSLISNITYYLSETTNGIQKATNVLGSISNVANAALTFIGKYYADASNAAAPTVMEIVNTIQPTILDINAAMFEVGLVLSNSLSVLKTGGEWANEIRQATITGQQYLGQATAIAREGIKDYIEDFDYDVDNPFTQISATEFKDRMRREIRESFMASKLWGDIEKSIKHRLYDANTTFRSGVDGYFDGINGLVRGAIGGALSVLDDTINSAIEDSIGQYMGAAKITGHADINEDGLRRLRLDGEFHLKMPEEMTFKAFLEILEIDSENGVEGCYPEGGSATEVTLGALDVPCDWISPDLKVSVTAKFVLDDTGGLVGLGGSVMAKGKITLGTVEIKQLGLNLMFGKFENYGAAVCRVRVNGSIEVGGGIFAGKTCSYDPILFSLQAVSPKLVELIDPPDTFGALPITGALFFADGEFPVWSYGCLLEIRVIAGAGAWYFNKGENYGMIMRLGVAGTVVCVLSAKGTATLIGSPKPDGFTLLGSIYAEGCLGPCPLCFCGDVEEAVKYVEGKGWEEVED